MDTIRAPDFRLVSCQATLFTPEGAVSSVKLMQGLLPKWTELFDAEPTLGLVAEGLPREVPRLVLESTSQEWRCQIASARIDLFWQKPVTDLAEITLDAFFNEAIQRLNEYREFLDTRVGRLAAVLNRYAGHPTPGPFIARYFCQERLHAGPLAQLESCEVHTHQRLVLAERFKVNLWVRSKTGTLSSGQESSPIVVVEQDLNTLLEDMETQAFTSEDIKKFFLATVTQFDESLQLYYPAEGQP